MASLLELLGQTWPARMAKSAVGAAALPGDVYAGRVDPLSEEGIGRAADLAGMVMGGTFAGAPAGAMGSGAVKPIRAYHGSPHDFDRFDLSKIGTGEGAQAYGHGLYFAENPATAQTYKDAMRVTDMNWPVKGTEYDLPAWVARTAQNSPRALDEVRQNFVGRVEEAKRELAAGDHNASSRLYHTQRVVDALDAVKAGAELQKPGRMYEVNINADPAHMLNWDATVPKGAPVRGMIADEAMKRTGSAYADVRNAGKDAFLSATSPELTGEGAYRSLVRANLSMPRGEAVTRASSMLNEAGIPGIKYLDQGSRGVKEGTSNYVLFRDDIIDIVKKYGLAGAAAMYGISQDEAKAAMDDKPKTRIGNRTYEND